MSIQGIQDEEEFATPVLHGRRFDEHAVPLEVLRELDAYQHLILDVAKALFLERHPGRRRVPKGFEDRLALRLRHVEGGSAMPILLRSQPATTEQIPLLSPSPDEFEEARDMIAAAVAAAANGKPLPARFPRDVLGRFNTFGRTLRRGEAIELRATRDVRGPKYDQTLRRKLVLMGQKSFSDAVDLVGTIREADVDKGVFHLLVESQKVPGNFGPEHEAPILAALKEHQSLRIRVIGSGSFDAQERLERIDELDEVTILETEALDGVALAKRIAELKALPPGWLDGDTGEILDPAGLDSLAATLIALHDEEELPLPHLYPTPEGSVQAEWSIDTWEVSAEIDLTTGEVELDAVHRGSGAGKEMTASIATLAGRLELVKFIASFQSRGI